jgi:hypothetical protein
MRTPKQSLAAPPLRPMAWSPIPAQGRPGPNLKGTSILAVQRTIGNQGMHRLLTQASTGIQREEAPLPQFGLGDGGVVVNHFQVENSPWPGVPDRARQTASLELTFVPPVSSRFAAPASINWFQTVRTNSRGGSEPVRPADEYPIDPPVAFVDGYLDTGPDRQRAQFWNIAATTFRDHPARDNLPDRVITWRAETSCIGITEQENERLITLTWGFTIDQRGRGREIPLTSVRSPSPYHLQKFRELPHQRPQEEPRL